MIRKLTVDEVPLMVRAGHLFFEEGKLPGGLNPDVFVATWKKLISTGVGVVFVLIGESGPQGFLGAVTYPDLFNGDKVAVENYWFVLPEFRGRGILLLNEFERWAKAEGCKRVSMVHLQRLQPDRLKELYESRGYQHIESAYVKSL